MLQVLDTDSVHSSAALLALNEPDQHSIPQCWQLTTDQLHNLGQVRGGLHSQSADWYWPTKQCGKIHKLYSL